MKTSINVIFKKLTSIACITNTGDASLGLVFSSFNVKGMWIFGIVKLQNFRFFFGFSQILGLHHSRIKKQVGMKGGEILHIKK